jgi:hypothetical protein
MEYTSLEIAHLDSTVNESVDAQLRELNDLQLAIVGGGAGEVVFV